MRSSAVTQLRGSSQRQRGDGGGEEERNRGKKGCWERRKGTVDHGGIHQMYDFCYLGVSLELDRTSCGAATLAKMADDKNSFLLS